MNDNIARIGPDFFTLDVRLAHARHIPPCSDAYESRRRPTHQICFSPPSCALLFAFDLRVRAPFTGVHSQNDAANAGKGIKNNAARIGHIQNGVLQKLDRLWCWMFRKKLVPLSRRRVHTIAELGICPIATMTPELHVVQIGRGPIFEVDDKLCLRPKNATLPALLFNPGTHRLRTSKYHGTCPQKLEQEVITHEQGMQASVHAVGSHVAHGHCQEARKFVRRILAATHLEIVVFEAPISRDDRVVKIVGHIAQTKPSAIPTH